jgi:hypothetical protein
MSKARDLIYISYNIWKCRHNSRYIEKKCAFISNTVFAVIKYVGLAIVGFRPNERKENKILG